MGTFVPLASGSCCPFLNTFTQIHLVPFGWADVFRCTAEPAVTSLPKQVTPAALAPRTLPVIPRQSLT